MDDSLQPRVHANKESEAALGDGQLPSGLILNYVATVLAFKIKCPQNTLLCSCLNLFLLNILRGVSHTIAFFS